MSMGGNRRMGPDMRDMHDMHDMQLVVGELTARRTGINCSPRSACGIWVQGDLCASTRHH
jgi:hypothetical protein